MTDEINKSFLYEQIDTTGRQKITFGATILEENFAYIDISQKKFKVNSREFSCKAFFNLVIRGLA